MTDRPVVRKLLNDVLRSDSDLNAFCADYFPKVYERFTNGMDRVEKVTLLLDQVTTSRIISALRQVDPEAPEKIKEALRATSPAGGSGRRAAPAGTLQLALDPTEGMRKLPTPELPPHFLARPNPAEPEP